jgi:hypothetical protein
LRSRENLRTKTEAQQNFEPRRIILYGKLAFQNWFSGYVGPVEQGKVLTYAIYPNYTVKIVLGLSQNYFTFLKVNFLLFGSEFACKLSASKVQTYSASQVSPEKIEIYC